MAIRVGHDPHGLMGLPNEAPMGRREGMLFQDALRRRAKGEAFQYGIYDQMLRGGQQRQMMADRDARMLEMQANQQGFQQQQQAQQFQQQQQILQQQAQQRQDQFNFEFNAKQQRELAQLAQEDQALTAQIAQFEGLMNAAQTPQEQHAHHQRIQERMQALEQIRAKQGSIQPLPVPKPPPPQPIAQQIQTDGGWTDYEGNFHEGTPPPGMAVSRDRSGALKYTPLKPPPTDEQAKDAKEIEIKRMDTLVKLQSEKAKHIAALRKIMKPTDDGATPVYSIEEAEAEAERIFGETIQSLQAPMQTAPPQPEPMPPEQAMPPEAMGAPEEMLGAEMEQPPIDIPAMLDRSPELQRLADQFRRRDNGEKFNEEMVANFETTIENPAVRPMSQNQVRHGAVYSIGDKLYVGIVAGGRVRFAELPGG